MTDKLLQQCLEIAKQTALNAGEEILNLYKAGDYDSFQKDDESPVTTADYRANEMITRALQMLTPEIPIMSEESDNPMLSERSKWHRYWLIDPIDGTQEFIARSGDFAVNIALIENNIPVIGVIYWPAAETLYYASQGQGAFKTCPRETRQIQVRKLADPHHSVLMVAISRRQASDRVMSKMNASREYQTLPAGSCSLKACFIAEGKADIFLRIGVTGEWDTGASQCIVSEAGGSICAANFEPLTYNQRDSLVNPDFLVLGDQRVDWQSVVQYRDDRIATG